jgi:hypothetical protein
MITFSSETLHKVVVFDEVSKLSRQDLVDFHEELKSVVAVLDQVIETNNKRADLSGIPANADWMHRINTKRRIALKFAVEVGSQLKGGTTVHQRAEYEKIYKAKFRKFLEEEFGVTELEEIEQEIVAESKKEYVGWIEKTGQQMWFLP